MIDGMSVVEAAAWIGVPPDTLSRVLDGHEGISPELASQLESRRLVPQDPVVAPASCLRRSAGQDPERAPETVRRNTSSPSCVLLDPQEET